MVVVDNLLLDLNFYRIDAQEYADFVFIVWEWVVSLTYDTVSGGRAGSPEKTERCVKTWLLVNSSMMDIMVFTRKRELPGLLTGLKTLHRHFNIVGLTHH